MFASLVFRFLLTTLSFFYIKTDAFTIHSRSELYVATAEPFYREISKNFIATTRPSQSMLLSKVSPGDIDCNHDWRNNDWFVPTNGIKKILVSSFVAFILSTSVSAADTNRIISGQDWSNGNYEQQNFSGVVAVGTNFQKSNLQGCNFDKAILINADLTGADIRGASFKDTVLDGTLMKDVNAVKTIFSASILDVGTLENADLTDSLWPSKLQIMICDMSTLKGTSSGGVDTRDSILCSI